jgi:hypothetical protein
MRMKYKLESLTSNSVKAVKESVGYMEKPIHGLMQTRLYYESLR